MAWDRRKLLGALAGSSVVSVAGCASVEDDDSADDGSADDGGSDDGSADDGSADDGESGGESELWYDFQEGELIIMEDALESYHGQSNNQIEGVDVTEMQDRLTSAIPTGEGPDSFIWAHDWAGDFSESGFLEAQTGNFDVDLDRFTSPAQQAVTFEDEVWGLPVSAETVGLLYNKDMVDEPPETISEMKSIMDEHHDPANNRYGLSFNIDAYFVSGYAHAFGGFYYQADGHELGLTKQETIDGLRIVTDELDEYSPSDYDYGPQAAVFAEGRAPFAINGPWELGNADFDAGVAKLPAPEGGTPAPYSGVQMFYFADGVSDNPESADAARDFAEWYATNTDLLSRLAEEQGFIPVLDELAGNDDLPETVKGFSASAADGTPMPAHPRMNKVWSPAEDAILNAITGGKELETTLEEAESRIRENWE